MAMWAHSSAQNYQFENLAAQKNFLLVGLDIFHFYMDKISLNSSHYYGNIPYPGYSLASVITDYSRPHYFSPEYSGNLGLKSYLVCRKLD